MAAVEPIEVEVKVYVDDVTVRDIAPDAVIAITKTEIKDYAAQAARLAAGLSVPLATIPPSVDAWRAVAEQAAQLAVIAAGIADVGEAG